VQASTYVFGTLLAYKKSALLRTGIELGVFARLAEQPATADEVARDLELAPRGSRLLLNALVCIDALEEADGTYRLAPVTAETLDPAREGYLGDMSRILTSRWEWEAMGRLPEAVRRGGPVIAEHVDKLDFPYFEEFATHANAVSEPTAARVARTIYDWAAQRERLHILDLACGPGVYGFTIAQQHPRARVWAVDNSEVLKITQEHAARLGVADRVETIAGDMFTLDLGGPYDLVLITNVLHHYTPERATELLRRAAAVTNPGGKLILVGITADDGPVRDSPDAHLFSLLMLVWTENGEAPSVGYFQRLLSATGYKDMRLHRQAELPMRIMVADRA
jgi:2-polyprenyl-3-methyl-5-hydroxy-6-metoxy-1,4-benzoquinol methylase